MRTLSICILCGLLAGMSVQSVCAQEFEPEAGFQPLQKTSKQVDISENNVVDTDSGKKKGVPFEYGDGPFRANPEPRMSATKQMILMRAAYRAKQRVARIERNKWRGYSAQRPSVVGVQGGLTGVNSFYNPYYYSHNYFSPRTIIGPRYIDGPWLSGYYTR